MSKSSDGAMGILHPVNRKKFFGKIGITEDKIVNMHLTHGNKIVRVDQKDGGKLLEGTDGIITNSDQIYLAVLIADCLPVAIYDPVTNSSGLVHSGWRGLHRGIIKNAVTQMSREYGSKPSDLTAFIGSHICQKHYEVKEDVSSKFKKYPKAILKNKEKIYLDLGEVARQQLVGVGIKNKNIKIDPTCTFENKELFSFRRGDKKERNLFLFHL
jgi:YfiH family protein